MTNCEKAIEILQRTHDGDDLAPQHLRLVELAVNDMVTEVGQAAFEQLYNHIAGNTYVQPWYHRSRISGRITAGTCTGRASRWTTTVLTSTRMPTSCLRIGRPLPHPGDVGPSCFNCAPSLVVRRTRPLTA